MNTNTKPSYWYCDACNRILQHGEYRFNCTICLNYDYCEACMMIVDPPHPHRMVPELAYGQEEKIEFIRFDMASTIRAAIAMYSDRHCMGIRDVNKDQHSIYMDSYTWLTFKTIGDRSKNFGNGLRQFIEPRGYLCICAGNRPEWMITDFACMLQCIVSVPMYTLFNDPEMVYIINNTNISVVVCDKSMMSRFIGIQSECPSLKHVVCMDPICDIKSDMLENRLSIHYMGKVEQAGLLNKYDYMTIEPDDCLTIIYTSGSTGFPKGAIISDSAFRATFPRWGLASSVEYVTLSYRPLAWAADRDAIINSFLSGGRTGFSTGDPARLMEELALVRPTHFGAPPSIWNKIFGEFKASLAIITTRSSPTAIADEEQQLLQQFSKLIPNRCRSITIGGAMVSPVVLDFMKRCFTQCSVNESYGITECGGVTYDNLMDHSLQYRLESVPEMGYTVEDKPFSRGELLVKTSQMFSGYINNPEETHATLTEDGFFRTGDVVELHSSDDGQINIHIIDRKKSFFKISQGLFISPEFLQSIYIKSHFVEQIYIHGDIFFDSVSAVIVPNRKYAEAFAVEHNLTDFDTKRPHPKFVAAILEDLRSIGERELLQKHEIPSRIIIDFEPFTPLNGLLTSSMKPCRHKLAAYYGSRLRQPISIEQRLKSIVELVTGHTISTETTNENVFLSIGGNSLAAVRLSQMISNDLGIPLSLNILLDPNMNLQQIASVIEDPSKLSLRAQSIPLKLINDCHLDFNIRVDQHKHTIESPSTMFVTGTTGFVGAFLLEELLTIYSSNCKFVCLVRCETSIDPLDRIRQNMLFYHIWKDDYKQRIIPLQGDLAKSHFGLDDQTYESLTQQIDIIFHCGATVNFILPYSQLYDSNVCGTREIIRFATYTPTACIPIQYVSTISVLPSDINTEISIDKTSPEQLNGGYAQSKWVAERLISKAIHSGLFVNIYRLGWICADTRTGVCNQHDIYTLLIAAMMRISCYPQSFSQFHLKGLPVDFTAKSIIYLSSRQPNAYGNIYHVINRNSNIKFIDIIDGMHNCGIDIRGVVHDEWGKKIKSINDQSNHLMSIVEFFSDTTFRETSTVSNDLFSSAICNLDCPSFTNLYLYKWLSFIRDNFVG